MREIYPKPVRLGPADPPVSDDLIDELAARYAYPDQPYPGQPNPNQPNPSQHWVRANMVASTDGAGTVDGRSGGLSGAADRLVFSVLRSLADVILVGAGTVRAERYGRVRPEDLWPRLRAGRAASPPIAVLTRRLDLDLRGRLLGGADGADSVVGGLARPIILTTHAAPADKLTAAAKVADVIVSDDMSAAAAIGALADLGHRRILTEGGPTLLGQLIAAGQLDELCLTISPILEGGHATRITAPAPASQGALSDPRGVPESRPPVSALRLATVLEDAGFLLTRYVRASSVLCGL